MRQSAECTSANGLVACRQYTGCLGAGQDVNPSAGLHSVAAVLAHGRPPTLGPNRWRANHFHRPGPGVLLLSHPWFELSAPYSLMEVTTHAHESETGRCDGTLWPADGQLFWKVESSADDFRPRRPQPGTRDDMRR